MSNWYFTAETNARGLVYVKAYQTKWDPDKKSSRSYNRRHVGRMLEDGRVVVGKSFLADFPEYGEFQPYYGVDKRLVDEETYRLQQSSIREADSDGDKSCKDDVLNVGLTWALESMAEECGMYRSLSDVFGENHARTLLHLAIFKIDSPFSVSAYQEWADSVWLGQDSPLCDRHIRELLSSVDRECVERFFRSRQQNKRCKASGKPMIHVLDGTHVSSSLPSFADAVYGVAGIGSESRKTNHTFACDCTDGEIIFAHSCNGNVDDETALQESLFRMRERGLNPENIVLVTDRSLSAIATAAKAFSSDIGFIKGERVNSDAVRMLFDACRESLRDVVCYDGDTDAYACSHAEKCSRIHLYRFPAADEEHMKVLANNANEIIKCRTEKREIPPDLRRTHGQFVIENVDGSLAINNQTVREAIRYAGTFVIRTNTAGDPFEALRAYRLRRVAESSFAQYMTWFEGGNTLCADSGWLGKFFVCTLSVSLRLMMIRRMQSNAGISGCSAGRMTLDDLLAVLRNVKAVKRPKGNAWVVRPLVRKQRDALALLGFDALPKTLK